MGAGRPTTRVGCGLPAGVLLQWGMWMNLGGREGRLWWGFIVDVVGRWGRSVLLVDSTWECGG